MSRLGFVALSVLAVGIAGCADSRTSPTAVAGSPVLSERVAGTGMSDADDDAGHGDGARVVRMRDECDPASFNAAIGPNTCVRNGSITFDRFVAELTKTRLAAQWRFDPSEVELDPRASLFAVNKGGEVHTFTRVAKFGGGIVGFLNGLSGNTTVAPECTTLEPDDFVAAGATYTAELSSDELQHFQCCIHPWMRTDVRLKHHS